MTLRADRDARRTSRRLTGGGLLLMVLAAGPVTAQEQGDAEGSRCFILCAPELKVEPTMTFENFANRALVEVTDAETGEVSTIRQEAETVFELILALDIPTQIPRVGVTLETIFLPFGESATNPFGRPATDLGVASSRDNGIEFELELNLDWLTGDQTNGWVQSHVDIVDKLSPAERATDTSAYTHKLNFELDTAFLLFNWLPEGNWLKQVELEGSLDYVATGLPSAGDVVGAERYLGDASRWSFSLVAVLPMAPLRP